MAYEFVVQDEPVVRTFTSDAKPPQPAMTVVYRVAPLGQDKWLKGCRDHDVTPAELLNGNGDAVGVPALQMMNDLTRKSVIEILRFEANGEPVNIRNANGSAPSDPLKQHKDRILYAVPGLMKAALDEALEIGDRIQEQRGNLEPASA